MPGTSRLAEIVIVTGNTTTPFGIDTTVPTTARMYDYWLGGHDNFAVDRKAALEVSEVAPEAPLMARENRKFLRRAVRYLCCRGRNQSVPGHRYGPAYRGQRAPGCPGN